MIVIIKRLATGIQWVGMRDAAKHPTFAGASPTIKNHPVQNVKIAKVGKPYSVFSDKKNVLLA